MHTIIDTLVWYDTMRKQHNIIFSYTSFEFLLRKGMNNNHKLYASLRKKSRGTPVLTRAQFLHSTPLAQFIAKSIFLVSIGINDLIAYEQNAARPPIGNFTSSVSNRFETLMRVGVNPDQLLNVTVLLRRLPVRVSSSWPTISSTSDTHGSDDCVRQRPSK